MIAPPQPQWNDALLLGYAPMDALHQEFVVIVAALRATQDDQLPQQLEVMAKHLRQHFSEEDRWMVETDFPARECHMEEHAAVLRSVEQVGTQLAQGDVTECRRLAEELVKWFPGHADYLDSALAHWVCKQRLGGKPVVLRRDLMPPSAA